MLRVGITGGIGSGKTVVSNIFKVLGIPVFDADREARTIMESDGILMQQIVDAFGEAAYNNGKLNRAYLGEIVFNNAYKLEQLNALVHPAAIAVANRWMQRQTTPYVLKEAALMFESGSAENVDVVIGVHAPTSLRMQRAMHRDSLSRDQVLARMNKQLDEHIKMKLCDFVIVNDEQHLLIPQVVALHQQLLQKAGVQPD